MISKQATDVARLQSEEELAQGILKVVPQVRPSTVAYIPEDPSNLAIAADNPHPSTRTVALEIIHLYCFRVSCAGIASVPPQPQCCQSNGLLH